MGSLDFVTDGKVANSLRLKNADFVGQAWNDSGVYVAGEDYGPLVGAGGRILAPIAICNAPSAIQGGANRWTRLQRMADDALLDARGIAPSTLPVRTNAQLVQDVATRAEAWGTRNGLSTTGREEGALKHGYADRLLTRYQDIYGNRGLSTEVRYINGAPWQTGDGLKGSIRLDVVEGSLASPISVFDYKFGNATLTPTRILQIQRVGGIGPTVPVLEVKP